MNRSLVLSLLIVFSLQAPPFGYTQETKTQTTRSSSRLDVTEAWSLGHIPYSVQLSATAGKKEGTTVPKAGHTFVAVEFLISSEGQVKLNDSEVILTDSSGSRYSPIGIAPFSINQFIPFEVLPSGQVTGTVTNDGWFFSLHKKQDQAEFELKPLATKEPLSKKFILVYEVLSERDGFNVTVTNSKPISLNVKPK